jgi:CRISPR/Cas system Type II protein with McrA/HNH and RuvC-like nuclease domain
MKFTINQAAEIWNKTKGKCFYCGKDLQDSNTHIDHFYPKAHGGRDIVENYVPSCRSCNLSKRDLDVLSFKEKYIYKTLSVRPFTSKQRMFLYNTFDVDIADFIDNKVQKYIFYYEKMNIQEPDCKRCNDWEE